MTISRKLTGFLLLTGLCSTSLQAIASPRSDWYAGIKAGWSDYYNSDTGRNLTPGAESDYTLHGSNAVGGVFFGYQALDWLGVEGGYDYLGNASFSSSTAAGASLKAQGIQMSLKMSLPVTESLSLYSRLGMMGWFTQVESSGHTNTDNGISPLAALGTEFSFGDQLAIRLEYQYTANLGNGGDDGVVVDNGQTALGVVYNFGQQETASLPEKPIPVPAAIVKPIMLNTSVHFESGSSELTDNDKHTLQDLLKEINSRHLTQVRIIVAGYADRTGFSAGNQTLSEDRANKVADELRKYSGLKMSLIASGEGVSEQSGIICDKRLNRLALAQCLSPDRRVDITITGDQKFML